MQNGSRELHHAPFGGSFVISELGLAMINICAEFEVPIFIHYGNTKDNAQCIQLYQVTPMERAVFPHAHVVHRAYKGFRQQK